MMKLSPLAEQINAIEDGVRFTDPKPRNHPLHKICAAVAAEMACHLEEQGFKFAAPAESPIEEVFGTAVWAHFRYMSSANRLSILPAEDFDEACKVLAGQGARVDQVLATSQYQIEDMRVDFCLAGKNWRTDKVFRLVIECDGHDFHERTKEQAAKDRARDRGLQEKGYNIFRFTGSEIWRDPMGCVEQVDDWLEHKSCEKP
jgi:very-short-patch-repair endonuclease